ncbi:isoleucine--tRNA ligase [Salinarchaeum sp. IM2453]|uniref:isoleucine--tRNA ligase n=1 Tax=Salinarchaeum sp. IM2453 TaxID=2862870 RepID=UPI001C83D2A7|nr:isoleucine--tRNA ligase [Salinarchaeum sp. IM2453]QZA89389.1 isoleucine--tRNA ligase [Salinarchaeum sp. IM2453]
MSRFEDVSDQYDPNAVESEMFEYWEETDAYERTVDHREGNESFFFVDGPPYTSGAAHMGTAWNKTLKDAILRYHRMQGYDVTDRPGYDMHGLPIETKVEEKLGFENKKDIEDFGMENFIEECNSFAHEQLDGLQSDFQSLGVWMDWDNPYKTVSPEYMEAAWWGFEKAHERGLVEQGKRSINQCPRCETAIANNEVEYHEVEKPSIYVKFSLRNREGSLVIWTTTPWTIIANTFVAADGDLSYVGVDAVKDGHTERLYMAEACVEDVLKRGRYEDYEVVEEYSGEELVGWEYEHPLDEYISDPVTGDDVHQVYTADYVEADRTGLVHSAPGHGEEDFDRGQELNLPVFCPVTGDGTFADEAGQYSGTFIRDANSTIIDDLNTTGHLLASEDGHTVREGQCWRCDTDIVRLVTDQWFITITDIKDELIENLKESKWYPQEARDNRFLNFVQDSPDWNVSRQRYWGIPIPIWIPDDWSGNMDDAIVIGTRDELADRADQDIDPEQVDLHRPTVDDITITEDGTTYRRVQDVFDVWLDSGAASWGTLDYPSNTEDFEELWPADFILEAHDQTRGWFWSQLGMASAALGEVPYNEVLMHGWALDKDGRKMSKSLGNVVTPQEAIDRHGTDPMRAFVLSVNPHGEDMRFAWEELENTQRDLNILWNVFRFPLPYMELDDFDPATADPDAVSDSLRTIDQWLLSRLQTVIQTTSEFWDELRLDRAFETIMDFVIEDLSRFYVQAVRERMWREEDDPEKLAAYHTLTYTLREVVKLLAPYTPLLSEKIYQTLTVEAGHPTVHMCDWPTSVEEWQDKTLERDIEIIRATEEAGSNARQQADRKLRWPVRSVIIAPDNQRVYEAIDTHQELLSDRLNTRNIMLLTPDEEWGRLSYSAQADMSELGPAFGGRAGEVMNALNEARIDEPSLDVLSEQLHESGVLDSEDDLTEEMVEFVRETPDSVSGATIDETGNTLGVIYVDAALSDEIEAEGYAREVIRRIQEMRKELELDIEENIHLEYSIGDDRISELVAQHEGLIMEEVRAADITTVDSGLRREWDIEDISAEIAIASTE